jgi:hypothetical protein
MIDASLKKFDETTERLVPSGAVSQGRYARAYAKVLFHPNNNTTEFSAGLLAAVTTNLSLLKPAVTRHSQVQRCTS